MLHRKNWKRRFFVLYCVPQGDVLVYYDKQSVSGDDILGFVDLRKASSVTQAVAVRTCALYVDMQMLVRLRWYSRLRTRAAARRLGLCGLVPARS